MMKHDMNSSINQELYELGIDNEPLEVQKQMIEQVFKEDIKARFKFSLPTFEEQLNYLRNHLNNPIQNKLFYYYTACLISAIESLQNSPIELLEDETPYVKFACGKIMTYCLPKNDAFHAFFLLYQTFQTQYTYEYNMSVSLQFHL